MGASPDQLEQDIAQTRADLGETVDAIAERVAPRRVLPKVAAAVAGVSGTVLAWRFVRRRRGGT